MKSKSILNNPYECPYTYGTRINTVYLSGKRMNKSILGLDTFIVTGLVQYIYCFFVYLIFVPMEH